MKRRKKILRYTFCPVRDKMSSLGGFVTNICPRGFERRKHHFERDGSIDSQPTQLFSIISNIFFEINQPCVLYLQHIDHPRNSIHLPHAAVA
ncbi:MAG: hypothetical protein K1X68_08405 [Saprospiraceae bacterium]|nr:hypothetical protein [Saprospiraceae bacterium]HNI79618.1 hypothetical protein [Saprospiraceae bacterium]HNJ53777.1 hypothetical protein [Saprospiraceae bacterium]HNL19449.1 hypothetical protein [Saprospiraceae bacterium]HNN68114.1 hypothetical protein [Saprospiraceae bacterium]